MPIKKTSKSTFCKSSLAIRYLLHRFLMEGFSYRAAALAYTTLLAIVPLMIMMITILSFFPVFNGIDTELQQLILNNFVAQSANTIFAHLQEFLGNVHKLSKINLAFLIAIDLLMIYNINQAFNAAWRTTLTFRLSISFLIYILVLLLSPLLLGGVLILASLIYKIAFIHRLVNTNYYTGHAISFLLPYFITLTTFTVFNWLLPSCRVRIKHAFQGGLVTAIIFELAKSGFAFYLTHASTYRVVYGAMATLPLFLVWLYVSWLIILLGALVTNLIATGIPQHWQKR